MNDTVHGEDAAQLGVGLETFEAIRYRTIWTCEKWSQEQCDELAAKLSERDPTVDAQEMPSELLRTHIEVVGSPEDIVMVEGNLLLNEGLQRMLDLLIAAGGTAYNNANAYIGVGTSNAAEAATQTELQGAQDSSNRFYKAMVASYPQRTNQTVDWRSDFTSTEANFAWAEWTVSAGATTASGSGFLVGTTNLNRKVQALGTKATGTWTLTASITFS